MATEPLERTVLRQKLFESSASASLASQCTVRNAGRVRWLHLAGLAADTRLATLMSCRLLDGGSRLEVLTTIFPSATAAIPSEACSAEVGNCGACATSISLASAAPPLADVLLLLGVALAVIPW